VELVVAASTNDLVSIPPEDQREQITRLAAYLEKHFGRLPSGAGLPSAFGNRSFPPLSPPQRRLHACR